MLKSSEIDLKKTIESKLQEFTFYEVVFFLISILLIIYSSVFMKDSVLALISAACGIIYTIFAGKGKVYCYLFGIIGTLCCAYLSWDIGYYGSFLLHFAYYLPMEVIGFFAWRKHINKITNEVIKEKLSKTQLLYGSLCIVLCTTITYMVFLKIGDTFPIVDALVTVLSVAGMILTVRRSIEQWAVWTTVNFLSIMMWFDAFAAGERTFSLFAVRIIYFILGIYFYIRWKKEVDESPQTPISSCSFVQKHGEKSTKAVVSARTSQHE